STPGSYVESGPQMTDAPTSWNPPPLALRSAVRSHESGRNSKTSLLPDSMTEPGGECCWTYRSWRATWLTPRPDIPNKQQAELLRPLSIPAQHTTPREVASGGFSFQSYPSNSAQR